MIFVDFKIINFFIVTTRSDWFYQSFTVILRKDSEITAIGGVDISSISLLQQVYNT